MIFCLGDEPERIAAEKHNIAHTKYNDTVRKFHNRLQAEEAKYKERMEELQVRLRWRSKLQCSLHSLHSHNVTWLQTIPILQE